MIFQIKVVYKNLSILKEYFEEKNKNIKKIMKKYSKLMEKYWCIYSVEISDDQNSYFKTRKTKWHILLKDEED